MPSNDFQILKGRFLRLQGKDSVFQSLITLEGTMGNEILLTEEMSIYNAVIVEAVKEKNAIELVDGWKAKLSKALNDFTIEKTKLVSWNPAKYGLKFIKSDLWIDLNVYPTSKESKLFSAFFSATFLKAVKR